MKKARFYITFCMIFFFVSFINAQVSFKSIQTDFNNLSGAWEGSLTYLDYLSGKPYTMPADINIKRIGISNQFVFSITYPNETNANSIDTITISTDGKYINKEIIKSRLKLPNGDIEIVTEELGKDGNDNRDATFKLIYTLGLSTLINRKDVKYVGELEWIKRHEYSYVKKPSR